MARRTSRTATAVAALTLVAALGAAGCTSSDGDDDRSTAPSSGSTSPTLVAPSIAPTRAQRAIPADSQIVETPALRKTIALTSCKAAPQGWAGAGTAKNPTETTQTYRLLVFFTDKYSRTIDYARTEVKVAAGATASWRAATEFDPPAGTQCVLRGLYAVKTAS